MDVDDEVAEGVEDEDIDDEDVEDEVVEDADVTDGFALVKAEVLDVLESSEVVVGVFNKWSVIAALPQAICE